MAENTQFDIKQALDREAILKLAIDALHMEWQATESAMSYNEYVRYQGSDAHRYEEYLKHIDQARAALHKVMEHWK